MFNKTKLWLSVFPLIIINNFIATPAKATSNDAITLESIRAVSTTVLTGENIVIKQSENDVYYKNALKSTQTRGLRNFHNLFVKKMLIKF